MTAYTYFFFDISFSLSVPFLFLHFLPFIIPFFLFLSFLSFLLLKRPTQERSKMAHGTGPTGHGYSSTCTSMFSGGFGFISFLHNVRCVIFTPSHSLPPQSLHVPTTPYEGKTQRMSSVCWRHETVLLHPGMSRVLYVGIYEQHSSMLGKKCLLSCDCRLDISHVETKYDRKCKHHLISI